MSSYETTQELTLALKNVFPKGADFALVSTRTGQAQKYLLVVKERKSALEGIEDDVIDMLRQVSWQLYLHRGIVIEPKLIVVDEN